MKNEQSILYPSIVCTCFDPKHLKVLPTVSFFLLAASKKTGTFLLLVNGSDRKRLPDKNMAVTLGSELHMSSSSPEPAETIREPATLCSAGAGGGRVWRRWRLSVSCDVMVQRSRAEWLELRVWACGT